MPTLVIRNASVLDSPTASWKPRATIVVEGERIAAVLEAGAPVQVPEGAEVIDGTGRYVIPGLIDAHVHVAHLGELMFLTGDQFLPMFLAAGVTTVRSTGDPIVAEMGVKHFSELAPERSPRVITAGPLIDGPRPIHPVGYAMRRKDLVEPFVQDMAKWGVTTLKIYFKTRRPIGREVIAAGHRHGMVVTGHLGWYPAQHAVADGIDCLEHITSVFDFLIPDDIRDQSDHRSIVDLHNPKARALIDQIAEAGTVVDPTIVVFNHMIILNDLESVNQSPSLQHAPASMLESFEVYRRFKNHQPQTQATRKREIEKYQELTGLLHEAGVPLLVGTDAPEPYVVPGFAIHDEMDLLTGSGLSPAAILTAATTGNAKIIQRSDDLGSIEAGKLADLVILTDDPLQDIRNARQIQNVIRGGAVLNPADLLALVPA